MPSEGKFDYIINLKIEKMKKILVFCLIALFAGIVFQSSAQSIQTINTITLSTTDTLSGAVTKTYNKTISGNYNWSVQAFYDHLTGSTDSCHCTLYE